MSNGLRALVYAAALVIFSTLLGMTSVIYHRGQNLYSEHSGELLDATKDTAIEDLVQNTGVDISGAVVVTLAEKYRSMFPLVFVTGEMPDGFYDVSYVREPSNRQYVNPNKMFRLEIDRDVNGDPVALIFVQSGCSKPAYDLDTAALYVHKSQLEYAKLLEERAYQTNLQIYTTCLEEYATAHYGVLSKNGEQKSEQYWAQQAAIQQQAYEASRMGVGY